MIKRHVTQNPDNFNNPYKKQYSSSEITRNGNQERKKQKY